jgi:hypothetical protein
MNNQVFFSILVIVVGIILTTTGFILWNHSRKRVVFTCPLNNNVYKAYSIQFDPPISLDPSKTYCWKDEGTIMNIEVVQSARSFLSSRRICQNAAPLIVRIDGIKFTSPIPECFNDAEYFNAIADNLVVKERKP